MIDYTIKVIESSFAGPIDDKIIRWIEKNKKPIDKSYLTFIEKNHGVIPMNGEFTSEKGDLYKIGRFLTLVDETSELTSPTIQSKFKDRDARIDWSIYTLIGEESATYRGFIDGERLLPFAALYYGAHHPDEMDLSRANIDLLCFFYSFKQEVPTIVVWNGQKALEESFRVEELLEFEDLTEEEYYCAINYSSFVEPVSESFEAFIKQFS